VTSVRPSGDDRRLSCRVGTGSGARRRSAARGSWGVCIVPTGRCAAPPAWAATHARRSSWAPSTAWTNAEAAGPFRRPRPSEEALAEALRAAIGATAGREPSGAHRRGRAVRRRTVAPGAERGVGHRCRLLVRTSGPEPKDYGLLSRTANRASRTKELRCYGQFFRLRSQVTLNQRVPGSNPGGLTTPGSQIGKSS